MERQVIFRSLSSRISSWGFRLVSEPVPVRFSTEVPFPGPVYEIGNPTEPIFWCVPNRQGSLSELRNLCDRGRRFLREQNGVIVVASDLRTVLIGIAPPMEEPTWGTLNFSEPNGADLQILEDMGRAAAKPTYEDKLSTLREALDYRTLSRRFFNDTNTWKTEFETQIKAHFRRAGAPLDETKISNYAIILISRFLFLHVLERQRMLNKDPNYIRTKVLGDPQTGIAEIDDLYDVLFKPLFFQALALPREKRPAVLKNEDFPYLNGGLFSPYLGVEDTKEGKDFTLSDEAIRGFHQQCPYKYRIFSTEARDGRAAELDPELLGAVFERFMKDDLQASTGSFYTPRPVVLLTVRKALFQVLQDKGISEKTAFDLTFPDQSGSRRISKSECERAIQAIDSLKIFEPCCGSGGFLLCALEELHSMIGTIKEAEGKTNWGRREAYERILSKNLFGMDVNPEAIILCQLRLWLPIIGLIKTDRKELSEIVPLPNLELNIKLGNTLMSPDSEWEECPFKPEELRRLRDLRASYTSVHGADSKKVLSEIEKILADGGAEISPLRAFADILFDSKDCSRKGFDIVFGNPPYLGAKMTSSLEYMETRGQNGVTRFEGSQDLYIYFIEESHRFLKTDGRLKFIVSNSFFTNIYQKDFRKYLLGGDPIQKLSGLGITDLDARTFDNGAHTCILEFSKQKDGTDDTLSITYPLVKQKLKRDVVNPHVLHLVQDRDSVSKARSDFHATRKVAKSYVRERVPHDNFFVPNTTIDQFLQRYGKEWKQLTEKWWAKVSDIRELREAEKALTDYRNELKTGDLTLIGLVAEGGQGLATAFDAQHLAYLRGTDDARKAEAKVAKFNEDLGKNTKAGKKAREGQKALKKRLDLLEKKGHPYPSAEIDDIHKIIDPQQVLSVTTLSEEGKLSEQQIDEIRLNGVSKALAKKLGLKYPVYAPFYKGDPEGTRWVGRIPCYIDWSQENVAWMNKVSGQSFSGAPVVRTPAFYFRKGFAWNNVFTDLVKANIRTELGVSGHKMTLLSSCRKEVSEEFIVAYLNSDLMKYVIKVLTNTSMVEINHVRILPIVVPLKEVHEAIRKLVRQVLQLKARPAEESVTAAIAKCEADINELIYTLFGYEDDFPTKRAA